MECEVCGKECEQLFGKTKYSGNQDDRMMCTDCYKKVHGEDFDTVSKVM